jgi:hypothetical protein
VCGLVNSRHQVKPGDFVGDLSNSGATVFSQSRSLANTVRANYK